MSSIAHKSGKWPRPLKKTSSSSNTRNEGFRRAYAMRMLRHTLPAMIEETATHRPAVGGGKERAETTARSSSEGSGNFSPRQRFGRGKSEGIDKKEKVFPRKRLPEESYF